MEIPKGTVSSYREGCVVRTQVRVGLLISFVRFRVILWIVCPRFGAIRSTKSEAPRRNTKEHETLFWCRPLLPTPVGYFRRIPIKDCVSSVDRKPTDMDRPNAQVTAERTVQRQIMKMTSPMKIASSSTSIMCKRASSTLKKKEALKPMKAP